MPAGSCFCSATIRSIASPELAPGADWPWISKEDRPLKRCTLLGPITQWLVAKAEKGTISPVVLDRTIQLSRSLGKAR